MNEAQSTSADLKILSKIKQVPSNYLWCSQYLGGRGFRDSQVSQGALCRVSKWPALREGWSHFWVVIILQRPPATALFPQPTKQAFGIVPWLPLYPLRAAEDSSVVWVTFWIQAWIAKVQLRPQGPPHTIGPISTLPLFSCVYLTQHLWIWLFFCSATVW